MLLGAVIVIGHNVFHVVPNEVPIRAKSLGPGVGARIYRYRRGDRRIFRMGGVTARSARGQVVNADEGGSRSTKQTLNTQRPTPNAE